MPPQPDPHDTLDGGCAQTEERKSQDRGIQGSRAKIGNRNLIGCRVKVGSGVKVESRVRVTNEVKARSGPRAMGVMRVEHMASMRCQSPGSECPSVKRRSLASPPVAPHNRKSGMPSSWHPQVNGRSSSN